MMLESVILAVITTTPEKFAGGALCLLVNRQRS